MNTAAVRLQSAQARWLAPIVCGGVLAGTIDLVFACSFNYLRSGVAPTRVLQFIASGWLGNAAFEDVFPAAAIGFLSHYMILTIAAALFYAASRRVALLRAHAYWSGVAFGIAIYWTMHLVILPLSAAPPMKFAWTPFLADFSVHMFLLGPAIALCVRRFDRHATR